MTEYIRWESLSFLQSICWGAGLALAYDVLRVLRGLWRHPAWLVNVQDIVYWTAAGTALSVLMYYSSNGVVRAFLLTGAGLSAWLMYLVLTPWLVPLAVRLLRIPLGFFGYLWGILRKAVGKIVDFTRKVLSKIRFCFKLRVPTLSHKEKGR